MVKLVTCGRSFVEREAVKSGAIAGRDFEAREVPGQPGAVALRGTTLVGQLFLSLLVVGTS